MSYLWAMIAFFSVILLVITKGLIYSKSLETEKRIPVDDLELIDCKIYYPHAFAPRLTGIIKNKSTKFTLKKIILRINIMDNDVEKNKILLQAHQHLKVHIRPGKSEYLSEFTGITDKKTVKDVTQCVCEIIDCRGV